MIHTRRSSARLRAGRRLLSAGLFGLLFSLSPGLGLAQKAKKEIPSEEDFQERAQEHFERGRAYYAQERYADALIEFETAYRIQPTPDLRMNIGYALWGLGRIDEARREFRRFYRQAPEGPERQAALTALRQVSEEVGEDGLTPPARQFVRGAVFVSGAAALAAGITGGIALGEAALGGTPFQDNSLTTATKVSLAISAVAALSAAGVVYAERGPNPPPLQMLVGPSRIGVAVRF